MRTGPDFKPLGAAHATPEKFKDGAFTLKTHQIFSVHNAPENLKTQQLPP